ncbi:cleavage and polyadenylation specificity factor subunit 2 family protein [Trichuris suis]|nr:cleavage and polyadenylation specificity factor subunit 2 family protein [Trichuris suis]
MTSIVKLEPLSGVMDETPLCYVLQVDDFHFLLDCGWDSLFDMQYIDRLRVWVPHIDAVLLTFPDQQHIGALPYLVGKCGLSCPIYATVPVYRMGQMFMYDWFQSYKNMEDFSIFTLDDVDQMFEKVQQVKYSQTVSLKGRGHGLQIVPLPAGHMIGGTIWRISKMGEEEIVYAVDFNHKKERHLNGCSFESIARPSLLITDAFNMDFNQSRRKARDELLLTNIIQTLRNGGNCLIVVDTAGRVLELVQLLDQLWHNPEAGLLVYALVMMNCVAFNVVEFAKSQVEWMSDKILRSFQEGRNNPFQFRHMQLCHSLAELTRIRQPKVVLASHMDMESGFSRQLFLEWCIDPRNSVIFPSRSRAGTLAYRLIQMASNNTRSSRKITLEVKRRVLLEGSELDEYWREKKQKEQKATRARLEAQRRVNRKEQTMDEEGESSDEENIIDDKLSELPYDVMYDFVVRMETQAAKGNKRLQPTFRHIEEKVKWDDYGEIIHADHYAAAEGAQRAVEIIRERNPNDPEMPVLLMDVSEEEMPTKCLRIVQNLEVVCRLELIDFEGRSDSESIKKILHFSKPKQVIIVHGNPESTELLADYCRKSLGLPKEKVFTPKLGEVVDATIESHIYQVKLSDSIMSSLKFAKAKEVNHDVELAWVDARVVIRESGVCEDFTIPEPSVRNESLKMLYATADNTYLDVLHPGEIPPHKTVFVNEPKLSNLKQIFMLNGFQAEFVNGNLIINNAIALRKNEAGNLCMEGAACSTYFAVRDLIYKQFAII